MRSYDLIQPQPGLRLWEVRVRKKSSETRRFFLFCDQVDKERKMTGIQPEVRNGGRMSEEIKVERTPPSSLSPQTSRLSEARRKVGST